VGRCRESSASDTTVRSRHAEVHLRAVCIVEARTPVSLVEAVYRAAQREERVARDDMSVQMHLQRRALVRPNTAVACVLQ